MKQTDKESFKSIKLNFRVSPSEKQGLEQKLSEASMPLSYFLRVAITGAVIKARLTPEDRESLRMLRGLANNLNQLTKLLHQNAQMPGIVSQLQQTRARIDFLISKML